MSARKTCILAGLMALGLSSTAVAATNLLTNGGFETGDTTGWVKSGDMHDLHAISAPFFVVTGAQEGTFYLQNGGNGSDGVLTQTFADTPGVTYTVSGYVASGHGGAPSDFSLEINGTPFAGLNPVPQQNWTQYSTTFVGTGSDTLTIRGRNDPNELEFDNFVVAPPVVVPTLEVPALATLTAFLAGAALLVLRRRFAFGR